MDPIEIATGTPRHFFCSDLLYLLLMFLNWSLIFTHHPEFEFRLEVPLDTLWVMDQGLFPKAEFKVPIRLRFHYKKRKNSPWFFIDSHGACMILQKHFWTKVNLITHRLCKHFAYMGEALLSFKGTSNSMWFFNLFFFFLHITCSDFSLDVVPTSMEKSSNI